MSEITRALTIRQPWAGLVASGVKPIENRTWKTGARGRIAIHAGARVEKREIASLYGTYQAPAHTTYTSAIVGTAVIEEIHVEGELCGPQCTETIGNTTRTWAQFANARLGDRPVYHWRMTRPTLFQTPIPNIGGALGLWEILSPTTLDLVRIAQLENGSRS